ncbi:uncharacterized protein EDB93DRAFT_1240176 [Suillus bovinus]|uniref:uncharacterized protein n=1 Tax=Suillus bovinus TaxID=48563 RepID=UPI001B86916C|nr:uncharacterized protein EDB93DRAFT_1240176 [Suillus bovinus]KAG2151133.1 hypothetical protein EDB93DRAFT_1240176 [Suillus bovinus]
MFQDIRAQQEAQGLDPWAPFTDEKEWGLVKWLVSRVGHTAIDEFLKLPITSHMKTSFTSKYSLLKAIDKLPRATKWELKKINVVGNRTANDGQREMEDLELWLHNPVDCIRKLMSNPEFDQGVSYVPERVFADKEGKTQVFDEMWMGDWWWEMQHRLPKGAVVAPVILASDKTSLSQFCGDQEVWPVYLTLGNISKDIRHQPSKRAAILIAYLPISKLDAGEKGVEVTCPDHQVQRLYPIVAAYIADFPEQCLVACCMENRCPKCTVGRDNHGDMRESAPRRRDTTMANLRLHSEGEMSSDQFESKLGLRAIYSPFWAALSHNDIFLCMTPDILHQLHKGVFKDHLVSWCLKIIGKDELNTRFKAMSSYAGLRHFKKGISKCKQWTGADYRELERVFLCVIAGAVDNRVLASVRGVLDFIYYAQYQSHTEESLSRMQAALELFHANKNVFVEHGVREHFNIPKIHSMVHCVDSICLFGSANGFNTELPERLHIDFAKCAYCASNRCDYVIQMTTWLCRQESIYLQDAYLRWRASQHPTNNNSHSQDLDSSINSGSDDETPSPADHHQLRVADLPQQIHHFTMFTASRRYFVPRTCPFPNSMFQQLVDNHNTSLIIPALEQFLHHNLRTQPCRKLTLQDRVDVYKYVKVVSPARPHFNSAKCMFKVRASPEIAPKDTRKLLAPARYDTVLVIENWEEYTGEGISGLCVGEVKHVFNLPPHLGHFACLLVYIHWFHPLQTFNENLQSFRLTKSLWQHRPNAAVVPVDRVLRPVHLTPWISREAAEEFYLNRYIDLELFEHLL